MDCMLIGREGRANVKLNSSPFTIGRNPVAHIVLLDLFISRNHCELVLKEEQWHIADKSTTGTFVNGQLIGKGESRVLLHNDVIRLGQDEKTTVSWNFCRSAGSPVPKKRRRIEDQESDSFSEEQTMLLSQTQERKMIQLDMRKIELKYADKLKEAEERHAAERQLMKHKSAEDQLEMEQRAKEEKAEIERLAEEQKAQLEERLNANHEQIEQLRNALASNDALWEAKMMAQQSALDSRIRESEEEKRRQSELGKRFEQEEAEKRALQEKLKKMEQEKKSFEANKKKELEQSAAQLLQYHREQINALQESKMTLMAELKKKETTEVAAAATSAASSTATAASVENFEQLMESELQCIICSELIITAITLNCTHSFCQYCLMLWKKTKRTCPICRANISSENRALVLDNFISRMVDNLSDDFKKRRAETINERREAEKPPPPPPSARGRGRGGRQPRRGRGRGRGRGAASIAAQVPVVTLDDSVGPDVEEALQQSRRDALYRELEIETDHDSRMALLTELREMIPDGDEEGSEAAILDGMMDEEEEQFSRNFDHSDDYDSENDDLSDYSSPPHFRRYGSCFACGEPGHWAPECPRRRRRWL